jgi:hypothetical protein
MSHCIRRHKRRVALLIMVAVLPPATLMAQGQDDLVQRFLPLLSQVRGAFLEGARKNTLSA